MHTHANLMQQIDQGRISYIISYVPKPCIYFVSPPQNKYGELVVFVNKFEFGSIIVFSLTKTHETD